MLIRFGIAGQGFTKVSVGNASMAGRKEIFSMDWGRSCR